jgi:hypothetical protein
MRLSLAALALTLTGIVMSASPSYGQLVVAPPQPFVNPWRPAYIGPPYYNPWYVPPVATVYLNRQFYTPWSRFNSTVYISVPTPFLFGYGNP